MSGGAAWAEAEAARPPSPLMRMASPRPRMRRLRCWPPNATAGCCGFRSCSAPASAPISRWPASRTPGRRRRGGPCHRGGRSCCGRRPAVLVAAIGCIAVAAGATLAQWRAHQVAAPVLERRLGPIDLEGRVVSVDIRAEGRRIILDRLDIPGLPRCEDAGDSPRARARRRHGAGRRSRRDAGDPAAAAGAGRAGGLRLSAPGLVRAARRRRLQHRRRSTAGRRGRRHRACGSGSIGPARTWWSGSWPLFPGRRARSSRRS